VDGHVGERWSSAGRLVPLAASCLLVVVPFLSVQFAPITDLPQHLAQIRLFHEAITDPDGPYRIQWLTPYLLGYLPLALAWWLTPGTAAGRTAMLILALLWVLTIHWLAFRRGRAAAAAMLAGALFYNHATYWGFYSFAVGWPAFVLWFVLTTRPEDERFRVREVALYLGAAWLLYLGHALWLAAGLAWFVVRSALARTPLRIVARRVVSFAPVLVLVAVWYPRMSAGGFASPTLWVTLPSGRLSVSWIVDTTLGGLQGPLEYGMVGVLAGWIALGLYHHREQLAASLDRDLCLAAVFFAALALLLPDKHQNTIGFATRWEPIAAIMLVLGVPAPAWDRTFRTALATAAVAVFTVLTALAWVRFERDEMAGLDESLQSLPGNARVLGLDYVKTSAIIKGRPFLQGFAYAQVVRGSELNFSFAEFAPMAVVYKTRSPRPWTRGLEWFPERATRSDLSYFDYALVNAETRQHAALAASPELAPLTGHGRWRLYRIRTIPR